MPTARSLIIDAYHKSGVRSTMQDPDDDDTRLGLQRLNFDVIDQMRLNQKWPYFVKSYEFATTPGKIEYTIGIPSLDPLVPAPDCPINQELIEVEWAQVLIGSVWNPLRQISNTDYYRMVQPTAAATLPTQYAINRTRDPYDRIMFSMPASSTWDIRLAVKGSMPNYNLDDEISLPSGYYSCLSYALAAMLADEHGFEEKAAKLESKFAQALARIEDVNNHPVAKLKLNIRRGRWDVYSDSVISSSGGI